MSRNTVARLLSLDEAPRYRRKPRGSNLDPYKGSIPVVLELGRDHNHQLATQYYTWLQTHSDAPSSTEPPTCIWALVAGVVRS